MNNGVQFGIEGPNMTGTWYNPNTGHKFTVRDCFFQDNQFMVQTMDGQMLDYNTIQDYIQVNDANGNPTEPDPTVMASASTQTRNNLPPEVASIISDDYMTPEDSNISVGLGNLNTDRSVNYYQVASSTIDESDSADYQMVDRVLRKHPLPEFEVQNVWKCPTKQIDTLVNILGIEPDTIINYYLSKLDISEVYNKIKKDLNKFIDDIVTDLIEDVNVVPGEDEEEPTKPAKKKTPVKKTKK